MKAILFEQRQGFALENPPIPEISEGEVLIAVDACGLCGTDILKIKTRPESAVLGHEIAGRIEKIGPGVKGFREGDRVIAAHHVPCGTCHFCRHDNPSMCQQFKETNVTPGGFSQYVRLSALHVRSALLKIPDELDAEAASQTEPLACCLRNAKRLKIQEGDSVGIVGLGAIGQLTAMLLTRHFGASVFGLDLDQTRADFLKGWAFGFTEPTSLREAALEATSGRGLDALILTAGTSEMAAQSLSWIRGGGTLNIFASFHPDAAFFNLNEIYHRELTIMGSYSPALEDLKEALDLIASGKILVQEIATKNYSLESFGAALEDLRLRKTIKAMITPNS